MQNAGRCSRGFTLIEVLVSCGIIAILGLLVAQVYFTVVGQITYYREQTVIVDLADHYMEVARNLPYSHIGTQSGNPHGNLADAPNPIVTTVNDIVYNVYYVVNYLDDPADGTILAGSDAVPNDYKQVKLYVKNIQNNYLTYFLTNIVPKGLEGMGSGGAISFQVFDAVGQAVPGASIRIQNTALNPAIDLTRTSDGAGRWIEVGLPVSSNSYHITVTKSGYSSEQTYPASAQNPNPVKPDATVVNGQVTQVSFSIDKTSNLTFFIKDQICSPLPSIGLQIKGAKLIGTPDVLKFDNTYTSNGSGQINLTNIEWDSYTPTLTGSSYMIYGTSPIQQATIFPDTSEAFSLIIGEKTINALLVIVKDDSNSNPIEGAQVRLQKVNPSQDATKITGGSVLSQQDWSLGSGQESFIDPKRYFFDDGNIDTDEVPLGARLAKVNNDYVAEGILISSTFDTGTSATAYTTLSWQPTSQDPETQVKFQIATNNDNETWDFLGPDGTSNSYYATPGTTMSSANNNKRYLRYKAFLSTENPAKTPVLTSITINYVSGCFTPGQVIFPGLAAASDYQVMVTANDYQTQTINNLHIFGYDVLEVLMSQ